MRRILMASANHWTSPFQVGTHQLARTFAKLGWEVTFLSDPLSPLHFARGVTPELAARWKLWRGDGLADLDGQLWAYTPFAWLAPAHAPGLRSRWLHRNWWRLAMPSIARRLQRRGGLNFDILYFDNPKLSFLLDATHGHKSVLRIADYNPGFQRRAPAMQELEKSLARRVDAVAYTATSLAEYATSLGARRLLHLPNGVNAAHFMTPMAKPSEYENLRWPIIVYLGAIEEWFDFSLINEAAARCPEWEFVLIGPDTLAKRKLTPRENLHVLGSRPYDRAPAYLQHADIGIIPFDVRGHADLINRVNPLKLYEYLASGLPVVAAKWEELVLLKSPALLHESLDGFIDGARRMLTDRPDAATLQSFAAGHDWRSRAEALLAALGI